LAGNNLLGKWVETYNWQINIQNPFVLTLDIPKNFNVTLPMIDNNFKLKS
jgi:hypothetical protein